MTPEALFNDTALLTDVLQYHLLGDKVLSKDLKATQEVETFLEGRGFTVDKGADGVTITLPSGKKAKVVTANLKAGSNVVHIIDAVLIPGAKEEKPAAAAADKDSKLPASCEITIKKVRARWGCSLVAAAWLQRGPCPCLHPKRPERQPPQAHSPPHPPHPPQGDTVFDLSKKYGLTEAELLALNPTVTDPAKIVAGNKLKLCAGGAAAAAPGPKAAEA